MMYVMQVIYVHDVMYVLHGVCVCVLHGVYVILCMHVGMYMHVCVYACSVMECILR